MSIEAQPAANGAEARTAGAASPPGSVDLAPTALTLHWPDGKSRISATLLRQSCRCAECTARARRGEPVQARPDITLADAHLLGRYALQLVFSDGHDRGIYPWPYLRELAHGRRGLASGLTPSSQPPDAHPAP
jgi:DUF971 family protein